eukprot:COSAG01_NODE_18689_length_1059_cov_144.727083_2_plen_67_part_00
MQTQAQQHEIEEQGGMGTDLDQQRTEPLETLDALPVDTDLLASLHELASRNAALSYELRAGQTSHE